MLSVISSTHYAYVELQNMKWLHNGYSILHHYISNTGATLGNILLLDVY